MPPRFGRGRSRWVDRHPGPSIGRNLEHPKHLAAGWTFGRPTSVHASSAPTRSEPSVTQSVIDPPAPAPLDDPPARLPPAARHGPSGGRKAEPSGVAGDPRAVAGVRR